MRTKRTTPQNNRKSAVIIGGGIAGLSAARVVAKHFDEVTLIDRDHLPDEPAFRSGIPQAMHAHTLLPYGQLMLDKLFPGLVDHLIANGAQTIDDGRDTATYEAGLMRSTHAKSSRPTVSCSRPMLEGALYNEIAAYANVKVLQGYEVVGLIMDEANSSVTGLTIRNRQAAGDGLQQFSADLVIDASGRNSKAPQWLAHLGYVPPEEWRINAYAGYASRIYRQPENDQRNWKKLHIIPSPPDEPRGGVILPLEGGRWHVTLMGVAGDYPPTDEEGFLAFARSLSSPELYDAIRLAEPLSKIAGYRKNENRVRRFENLPRYLEGLLVLGDAAYTMNPVYALGMTAAFVSSQVLEQVIEKASVTSGASALSAVFQKKLAASMSNLWQLAVRSDWRWPATEISDNTEELYLQSLSVA